MRKSTGIPLPSGDPDGTPLDGVIDSDSPVDPAAAAADFDGAGGSGDSGTGRRTRSDAGQKRGPRGPNRKTSQANLKNIEYVLTGIHAVLAGWTEIDEIALEPDEATALAQGLKNVADEFPQAVIADPRLQALAGLGMVAATVYGSKFAAYRIRRKFEEAVEREQNPNVYRMPG